MSDWEFEELIDRLTREMGSAAEDLDFERAAWIRDELITLKGLPTKVE